MSCRASHIGHPFKFKYVGLGREEEQRGGRRLAQLEPESPARVGACRQSTLDKPLRCRLPRFLQASGHIQLSARALRPPMGYGLQGPWHQCHRRVRAHRHVDRWATLFEPPNQEWLDGAARQLSSILVPRRPHLLPFGVASSPRLAFSIRPFKPRQRSAMD